MGQTQSQEREEIVQTSEIFVLPEEVRLIIINLIPEKDRLALRQTSQYLCYEIDEYVGPVDNLHLDDLKSTQALDFYRNTVFQNIIISKACHFNGLEDLVYKPHMVNSISINECSSVNSNSLFQLLDKSKRNLKSLTIRGTVYGGIGPDNGDTVFPKVKDICILLADRYPSLPNYSLPILHRIGKTLGYWRWISRCLEMCWNLQLELLSRLTAPESEDIMLGLSTRANRLEENYDEIELWNLFVKFMVRHPLCQRLKIQFQTPGKLCWYPKNYRSFIPLEHSYYHSKALSLTPSGDPMQGPTPVDIPQDIGMKIREVTFVSNNDKSLNLQGNVLRFMKSLRGLEKIRILTMYHWDSTSMVIQFGLFPEWDCILPLIERNGMTLKELVVTGANYDEESTDPVPLPIQLFETCPNLQILWLEVEESGEIPLDLRIPLGMSSINLTVLILEHPTFQLPFVHFIPEMANLEYLSIRLIEEPKCELQDLVSILTMRSLRGLIFPTELVTWTDENGAFLSDTKEKVYGALEPLIVLPLKGEPYTVFFISDWVTPWWTRVDERGTIRYHNPDKIVKK